jgi:hypothetical protein
MPSVLLVMVFFSSTSPLSSRLFEVRLSCFTAIVLLFLLLILVERKLSEII